MTFAECAHAAARLLIDAGFPPDESRRDASLLARAALGWTQVRWLTDEHGEAPSGFDQTLHALALRRARHEPVAYITGEREFFGRQFRVTPAVLIPRPETEILVEEAIAALDTLRPRRQAPLVVDVGTGSGCVAVSVALECPQARVVATDISADALAIAQGNATALGATRIEFRRGSLLAGLDAAPDLIVSNPPYVAEADRPTLPPDVVGFEPGAALFGGLDGLDVIRDLVEVAGTSLAPGGALLMEIGAGQAPAVTRLVHATRRLSLARIRVDLQNIPRVVIATAR